MIAQDPYDVVRKGATDESQTGFGQLGRPTAPSSKPVRY